MVRAGLLRALGARIDLVYSRAWFAESTPSGSLEGLVGQDGTDLGLGSPSANLGLEADVKLFYDSTEGFHAWLQYGMFIPFGGLNRAVVIESDIAAEDNEARVNADGEAVKLLDAKIAHTIQVMLGVTF